MLIDERKENIEEETNKMVDIEVPTCCSTKTALFNKVHVVVCLYLSCLVNYMPKHSFVPKGPHRSV